MTTGVGAFIAEQRALPHRLERFVQTPGYKQLLSTLNDHASADPEAWLAEWLIHPAYGLGACPIDVAAQPGGMEQVTQRLLRIIHNTGA